MEAWNTRALRFGEILDVSFQTVKENFGRMARLLLIFLGPAIVLELIALALSGRSLLVDRTIGVTFQGMLAASDALFSTYYEPSGEAGILGSLFYGVGSILASASIILVVAESRRDNPLALKDIARQALARFFPLLGGSICFFLIIALAASPFLLFAFGFAGITGVGEELLSLIIILVVFALLIYLMVRLSFYVPAIVTEKVSPGIGKSWRLTKKNVWRLIGLCLVVMTIVFVVVELPVILLGVLLGDSLLTRLFGALLGLVSVMFTSTAMAVAYFDLQVRNEAGDLKTLADQYDSGPIE